MYNSSDGVQKSSSSVGTTNQPVRKRERPDTKAMLSAAKPYYAVFSAKGKCSKAKVGSKPVAQVIGRADAQVTADDDVPAWWLSTEEDREFEKRAAASENDLPGDDDDDNADDQATESTPDEKSAEQALFDRLAHAIQSGDAVTVTAITGRVRPHYFRSLEQFHLLWGVLQLLGRGERPRHPGPLTLYLVAQQADGRIPLEKGRQLLREAAERAAIDDSPSEVLITHVREQHRARKINQHAEELSRQVASGATAEQILSIARFAADDLADLDREAVTQKPLYEWVTSDDFDRTDYRLDYLIEGTLVAGQPLVLGGALKAMKTSMLVDAAVSLASGAPATRTLGRIENY